jgi:hypothetical protein
MDENEPKKKKFETRVVIGKNGAIKKDIYIDGELFDWSVDLSAFQEAAKMGPHFKLAVQKDIAKHFMDSMSEFLGRRVTFEEIKKAHETGWI